MAKKDAGRQTPQQIKKRYDHCSKAWDQWRATYELAYTFAAPQRNLFDGQYEGQSQGGTKMSQVFDSTAISSLDRFANRIQANVFPPQREFCALSAGDSIPPAKKADVERILEAFKKRMFAVMRNSNFDIALGEFLHDLGVGTACMCIQPGDAASPVNYQAVSPYLVRFEEDQFGRPCNVYRSLRIKAELIEQTWKGAKLNDTLKKCVEDKPYEEVELIEATTKNLESGKWDYTVITQKGDHEVFHRTQRYSNWVISRYSKLAGEILGRGPVVNALPDIRTLNKVKELILKNAAIAVSGVWTGMDDGVLNPKTVRIAPGTVIGVARNGGPQGPSLQPLKTGTDFNVAQLVVNDLVMSIKRIMLDESLPPDTASARSATEIIERMKELAQNLGSAFGRLIDEVMIPVVETTLRVLDERGVIEFPLQVDGREVKVVPVSPLAAAQHMDEVESLVNYAQICAMMGEEGAVAVNFSEAIDWLGEKMGVPMTVRNSKDEREAKMEETRQAQQAQMMETVAAEAAVKSAGKGQPAPAAPMGAPA